MGKLCTYRILFVVVVLYSQHFRRQKTSEVEEKCKLKLNETMTENHKNQSNEHIIASDPTNNIFCYY